MSLKRTISKCTMEETAGGVINKKLVGDHLNTGVDDDRKSNYDAPFVNGTDIVEAEVYYHPITPPYPLGSIFPSHFTKKAYFPDGANVSPSPPQIFYPSHRSRSSSSSSSPSSSSMNSEMSEELMLSGYRASMLGSLSRRNNMLSTVYVMEKVLEYIDEVHRYYEQAKDITFAHLAHMLNSIPTACRYIQNLLEEKIGIPVPLVSGFVVNVTNFIIDEDIRDVTIGEAAQFLRNLLQSITRRCAQSLPDIFEDAKRFFQVILDRFKDYVVELWLKMKKINFPCEFGKKSDSLFLCMECHREHC